MSYENQACKHILAAIINQYLLNMKLLKNRVWYDSSSQLNKRILKIEDQDNTQILYLGKHGLFFEVKMEGNQPKKIIPLDIKEAYDFFTLYKDQFTPREYDRLCILYFKEFVPKQKKPDITIPPSALQIGNFDGEELWNFAGDRFILKTPATTTLINRHNALDFLEKYQERFEPGRLDTLLKNIFPTTYRRP